MRKDQPRLYWGFHDDKIKEMCSPGYDWSVWDTRQLIQILRHEQGREIKEFHDALKKELSTREHIPSMKEAKKIRQQKAQERKHR